MSARAVAMPEPTLELAALARALDGQPPPCTADAELWFDDPTAAALACRTRCPALAECAALADAVDARFGVWAGIDRERTTMTTDNRKQVRE